MGYFKLDKLDKLDKIVISLIFIVVSMFSIFDCFCFAASLPIDGVVVSGLSTSDDEGIFYESPNNSGICFPIEKGKTYRLIYNGDLGDINFVSCRSWLFPAAGVRFTDKYYPSPYDFTFTASYDGYLFAYKSISSGILDNSNCSLYETVSSFDSAIDLLSLNVGIFDFWSVFDNVIPYVLVVVLFAFGWWFFSHWIKEISKGREF